MKPNNIPNFRPNFFLLIALLSVLIVTASSCIPDFEGFTLTRLAAKVWSGVTKPLSEVTSGDPQDFPEGYMVNTDVNGQALLQGSIDDNPCEIYVFFDTTLLKRACEESTYSGSNVTCTEEGSNVFVTCSNHLAQTPTGEFEHISTWVSVTYLPEEKISVFIVLEGSGFVRPVVKEQGYQLGEEIELGTGQFLYTAPDDVLIEFPNLPAREPIDLPRLPEFYEFVPEIPIDEILGLGKEYEFEFLEINPEIDRILEDR